MEISDSSLMTQRLSKSHQHWDEVDKTLQLSVQHPPTAQRGLTQDRNAIANLHLFRQHT